MLTTIKVNPWLYSFLINFIAKAPKPPKPRDTLKAIIDAANVKVQQEIKRRNKGKDPEAQIQDLTRDEREEILVEVIKEQIENMKKPDGQKLSTEQKAGATTAIDALTAGFSLAFTMVPKGDELVYKDGYKPLPSIQTLEEKIAEAKKTMLVDLKLPEGQEQHEVFKNAIEEGAEPADIQKELNEANDISDEQRTAIQNWIYECDQIKRDHMREERQHQQDQVKHYLEHGKIDDKDTRALLEATLKGELAVDKFINDYGKGNTGKYTDLLTASRNSAQMALALGGIVTALAITPAMVGGVMLATDMSIASISVPGVLTAFETLAATNPALLAGIVLASTLGLATVVVGLFAAGEAAASGITGGEAKPIFEALQKTVPAPEEGQEVR